MDPKELAEELHRLRTAWPGQPETHVFLDDQGESGVVDLDRNMVLMCISKWWCITGISTNLTRPTPSGLGITSGLQEVQTVTFDTVNVASPVFPLFVVGPPKQNLSVWVPQRGTLPEGLRVKVYWRVLSEEETTRVLAFHQ